jgi:hypothetical protein
MARPTSLDFIVSWDPAQTADWSALAVLAWPVWIPDEVTKGRYRARRVGWVQPDTLDPEHVRILRNEYTAARARGEAPERPPMVLRHLDRWQNLNYVEQVRRVATMLQSPAFTGRAQLVMDVTGVGRPVFDMVKAEDLYPTGILLTGGSNVIREHGVVRVPKRDVVDSLRLVLQRGELQIPRRLALGEVLKAEMQNFTLTINPTTAHDSYAAPTREGEHDDLVLAVGMGCWAMADARRRAGPSVAYCGHGVEISRRFCPQCPASLFPKGAAEAAEAEAQAKREREREAALNPFSRVR